MRDEPAPMPEEEGLVQPEGAATPPDIPSTKDDRTMALFCHLGGVLVSFVVPLVVWLIKKDQSKFVDDQGKEALNFQITLFIAHVVCAFTICFTFGLLNVAVGITGLVLGIMGGIAANKGEVYRYPIIIRFIK